MPRALLLNLFAAALVAQPGPVIGPCPLFPADHVLNTRVDHLPVAGDSATLINTIGAARNVHPDFGSGLWEGSPIGIPFLLVPGSQQRYPVTFHYAAESDPGPYPVPLNAPVEGGSDRHVIVVDRDNCKLYEMFDATPLSSSWKAGSGAVFDLRSNALRPQTYTSADAAGLAILAGLVRYDEVLSGEIRHAIRFTAPQTRREYLWPARHYASNLTGSQYPPMGLRVRLKSNFDISGYSPLNQVILVAMKRYGMILADNGSPWYISGAPDQRWNNAELRQLRNLVGANFEVVDTSSLMIDPDSGQARQSGQVTVSVTPAAATVRAGGTLPMRASVSNHTYQGVTWSVNGIQGGTEAAGFIDTAGVYRAPVNPPARLRVTVTATSIAVPSASGSASVTVARRSR